MTELNESKYETACAAWTQNFLLFEFEALRECHLTILEELLFMHTWLNIYVDRVRTGDDEPQEIKILGRLSCREQTMLCHYYTSEITWNKHSS